MRVTPHLVAIAFGVLPANAAMSSELTRIFYSGYFEAHVSTQSLEGATFFISDGPGIRFKDGRHVAGMVVTRESAGLDTDFDLREYPAYLFGQKRLDGLSAEVADKFSRSHTELKVSLNDPAFDSARINDATLYTACSTRCEGYLVQDGQDEQILHLSSRGFNQADLINLLQGGDNATK